MMGIGSEEKSYVFNHLQDCQNGIDLAKINYGYDNKSLIQIKCTRSDFFNSTHPVPETPPVWITYLNRKIPVFFENDPPENSIVLKEHGCYYIQYDLIASAFYLLSGWQEYYSSDTDHLGRFPFNSSVQYQYGFTEIPVVNYYFRIISDVAANAGLVNHSNPKKTSVWISHDIDKCESSWLEDGFYLIKKGKIAKFSNLLFKKLKNQDNWKNLESLAFYLKKKAIFSTFFFLVKKGKTKNGYYNADYSFKEKYYQQIVGKLNKMGFETGLHGSFGTHSDARLLSEEMKESPYFKGGIRFHYLCFDNNITTDVLENAHVLYDASLGFAEAPGFRNSYCRPFFLWNFNKKSKSNVLEIPLMVMDNSLFHSKYRNWDNREAMHHLKEIFAEVKKAGGMFTVLWHNDRWTSFKYENWKKFFEEFLDYLQKENVIFLTGNEIYQKFINNNF